MMPTETMVARFTLPPACPKCNDAEHAWIGPRYRKASGQYGCLNHDSLEFSCGCCGYVLTRPCCDVAPLPALADLRCPTCGERASLDAVRCVACGTAFPSLSSVRSDHV